MFRFRMGNHLNKSNEETDIILPRFRIDLFSLYTLLWIDDWNSHRCKRLAILRFLIFDQHSEHMSNPNGGLLRVPLRFVRPGEQCVSSGGRQCWRQQFARQSGVVEQSIVRLFYYIGDVDRDIEHVRPGQANTANKHLKLTLPLDCKCMFYSIDPIYYNTFMYGWFVLVDFMD